jgi:transcriptional regulator
MATKKTKAKKEKKNQPSPGNPHVQRLGRVEKRFRELADAAGKDPGELLKELLDKGVTQTDLSEALECTRQAVGVMARRYGLEFPGARLDLNEAARQVSTQRDFKTFVEHYWGLLTQEQMAEELGTSVSTLKRRIRKMGIKKRKRTLKDLRG